MKGKRTKVFIVKKLWPLIVSGASASIMILAFFIPSIQDQWDRYQSRHIIQEYVAMGDDFVQENKFGMAVEAFAKAYELSGENRLDIEVKRLSAKINLIYEDSVWGNKPPEGLEEIDFQFLLHLQKGPEHAKQQASILTGYGIYLASLGRTGEAEQVFRKAIHLNTDEVLAYINFGNLMDQVGKEDEASKLYEKAIMLDPENKHAHYNLGLLLLQQNKWKEARHEFEVIIKIDPYNRDALTQLDFIHRQVIQ